MKALQLVTLGQPPVLADVTLPPPGPGELRIRVAACGLNFADLLSIEGRYQEKLPLPFVMGMELAGTVIATGAGVAGFAPGDRVAAYSGQGGLAPEANVPAERCLILPAGVDFVQGAAFPIAYGTSHLALDHRARLQPGETLFVTGAAGGVGLTAVEIGRRMGARVIASARGADKLEIARAAGAHEVFDSTEPSLRDRLRDLGGVDVVYDTIGGPGFLEALRAARPEGRLLAIGFAGGEVPQVPANLLLVKNLSVIGLYWGGYLRFAPAVLTHSLQTLAQWIAEGALRPHVSHTFPLQAAAEALECLRERRSTGKIVVTIET